MIVDNTREPIVFAAGDTLAFTRTVPGYLPSAGWALVYMLVNGDLPAVTINSTVSGAGWAVAVAPGDTAQWLPGEYTLSGEMVNAGTGERHQVYLGTLLVTEDLEAGSGQAPPQTFAQQMLAKIEAVMLGTADSNIMNSDVLGTRIDRIPPDKLREHHAYFTQLRRNELDVERAKNCLPSRNKIRPRFNVMQPGPGFGIGNVFGGVNR